MVKTKLHLDIWEQQITEGRTVCLPTVRTSCPTDIVSCGVKGVHNSKTEFTLSLRLAFLTTSGSTWPQNEIL